MLESAADLSSIKLDPVFVEARRAHVVDVKLQVAAVHDSQHQTQCVFGLVRVRQAHLRKDRDVQRAAGKLCSNTHNDEIPQLHVQANDFYSQQTDC